MVDMPRTGQASIYGDSFVGRPTASGEIYRHEGFTAALMPCGR
jgi:rare lipoprotein A (peptidoglycan hydrolase)